MLDAERLIVVAEFIASRGEGVHTEDADRRETELQAGGSVLRVVEDYAVLVGGGVAREEEVLPEVGGNERGARAVEGGDGFEFEVGNLRHDVVDEGVEEVEVTVGGELVADACGRDDGVVRGLLEVVKSFDFASVVRVAGLDEDIVVHDIASLEDVEVVAFLLIVVESGVLDGADAAVVSELCLHDCLFLFRVICICD